MTHAIYGLSPIGVNGALEADGEVHYYCSRECAEWDALTHRYVAPRYSAITENTDAIEGTVCERYECQQTVR
jgi:hypothetical protein